MASLIPIAVSAGASYLGSRGNKKAQNTALAGQSAALTQQGQLASKLGEIASERNTLTRPAYGQAINYYTGLLSGDRARNLQAVQPDIRRITDINTGSMANVTRNLRGASRDQAVSDLVRNRTADIGALTGAPRQNAAATLLGEGRMGNDAMAAAAQGAAGIFGNQSAGYGQQYQSLLEKQRDSNKQWEQLGSSLTKTLGPNWIQSLLGSDKGIPNVNLTKLGSFMGTPSYK